MGGMKKRRVALGAGVLLMALCSAGCGGTGSDAGPGVAEVPRSWSDPALLEPVADLEAENHRLVMNARGDAFLVWTYDDGTVWARRFTQAGGWETPVALKENSLQYAEEPDVAIGPDGNAMAVWTRFEAGGISVWASRYTVGAGWSAPALLEQQALDASAPDVEVDAAGQALVVWRQYNGQQWDIWANRFTPGAGWAVAAQIATNPTGDVDAPALAMQAQGEAVVVWGHQNTDATHGVNSVRFTPSAGWSGAQAVLTPASPLPFGNAVGDSMVRFDAAGRAVAAWTQANGGYFRVWVNELAPTGWGTPQQISTGTTTFAYDMDLASDATGHVLLAWTQHDPGGSSPRSLWTSHRAPGAGWGAPQQVETSAGVGSCFAPRLALDGRGRAVMAWVQDDDFSSAWAARWRAGGGWSDVRRLETAASDVTRPQLAGDAEGRAQVVWLQDDAAPGFFPSLFGAALR